MIDLNSEFKNKNTVVKFLSDDDALFIALKDQEPLVAAVEIKVYENNKYLCSYYKIWEETDTFNSVIYNSFIKKFLEDIKYREILDCSENLWSGIIKYTTDEGINQKCKDAINKLNKMKNPRFNDFANLKTYGLDKYSKMKKDKLIENINSNILKIIDLENFDDKNHNTVLKWINRGLNVNYAIRKVKTDLEIQNNIENKKNKKG